MTHAETKSGFWLCTILWKGMHALRWFFQFPRRLKISYLLFASHLLMVAWIIGAMSYTRYLSEWQTGVENSIQVAHISMNPIIDDLSLYASGLSYANINLPTTRKLFAATEKLLFFQVHAVSDYSPQPFSFAYSRDSNDVWQTDLTEDAEVAAQTKMRELEYLLGNSKTDKVKYSFLLNRAKERYDSIVSDREKTERFKYLYQRPDLLEGKHAFNERNQTLHIQLPLRNNSGGDIWAVFDASELLQLRNRVLWNIGKEAMFALLISTLVIMWATHWIVQPLRRLSSYMDRDIQKIDIAALPELNRDDEIGLLARGFRNLISRIRNQIAELERLAVIDPLTGLGSRRLYDTGGNAFLKQAQRGKLCFGMLVCDLDRFKLYNDSYGHAQGDEALRMIGRVIKRTFHRETDLAFRFGGEEFVILIQVAERGQVKEFAEQLRQAVLAENMEHPENVPIGLLSVSIGCVALNPQQSLSCTSLDSVFRKADKALYFAKNNGRNRVEIL